MNNNTLDKKIQTIASDVLLNDVNNQIVKQISIVKVDVKNGGDIAEIFYLHASNKSDQEVIKEVNKTSSFVSKLIAKRLDIYKSPKIIFTLYNDLEKINYVDEILKELNKKGEN